MALTAGTIRELEEKEVINLCDGTVLGYCVDFEIDLACAGIVALHVRRGGGWFSFRAPDPIRIAWSRIECIGDDAILVRVPPNEICPACDARKKRKM